jgi:uncharacterized protein YdhG (YjbR/CyaY superfamily)
MNRKTTRTIDDYISRFPKGVQVLLREMRLTIRQAAPEAEETISYRIPAFSFNGILVWFAAFKRHIGFYPRVSALAAFDKQLSKYKRARGSVQFPLDKPLPLNLIREIVKFRVKENLAKGKKK